MKKTGFAKRRDKNEPEIIEALEAVGCIVQPLSATGVPDLLVGFGGRTRLLEVKGPLNTRGKAGKHDLTPDQKSWFAGWRGEPIVVVRSIEDALTAIGLHVVSPGLYSYCPHHPQCNGREPRCCCADQHVLSTYPRSKP